MGDIKDGTETTLSFVSESELGREAMDDDKPLPEKPRFLEMHEQPGMEVVEHSNLEVVSPRQDLSSNRTWEKTSHLPEMPIIHGGYSNAGYPAPSEYATPHTAYSSTHSYDYLDRSGMASSLPPKNGIFRPDTICGLKKQMFWVIIALGVFVMVAAAAVGVGLGVALHKTDNVSSANSTSNSTGPFPPALAVGSTANNASITCPYNNQTLYTSSSGTQGDRQFLLLCGRDYSSVGDGAVDLSNQPTDSFAECIDLCAADSDCIGAGWGMYENMHICWLKSKLGKPNVSWTWYFAVEDAHATVDNTTTISAS